MMPQINVNFGNLQHNKTAPEFRREYPKICLCLFQQQRIYRPNLQVSKTTVKQGRGIVKLIQIRELVNYLIKYTNTHMQVFNNVMWVYTLQRLNIALKQMNVIYFYYYYLVCEAIVPIVPASGDSEDDCGEADGM
jgi:hypothetical protein